MTMLAVFSPHRFLRLAAGDAMNVARDPMLAFATAMSLLPALALHFAAGPMDAAALSAFGVASLSHCIVPLALMIPAVLIGWVTGFLLLEDRDEGTLLAIDVTPMGKTGFLAYRVTVTALLSAAITLYAWPLILPSATLATILSLAAIVAFNAIAAAVILPAIARNKVEGLALTKLTNLLSVVPLLAAIPSPWRYVAGIIPSYWVGELAGLSAVASLPLVVTLPIALAVNVAAVLLMVRLFRSRVG